MVRIYVTEVITVIGFRELSTDVCFELYKVLKLIKFFSMKRDMIP